MRYSFFSFLFSLVLILGFSFPCQAANGKVKLPKYKVGSIGEDIMVIDASKKVDGFWVYLPQGKSKKADNVVVFMHGYGAFNPMIFGGWIKHLVADGNIVIYPRYQKSLTRPLPKKFVSHALQGLKDAFLVLEDRGVDSDLWSSLDIVGHSYGGVISMNFAQNREAYELPPIKTIMICSAGTGPFKGGILSSYDKVSASLIIIDSQHDTTVGSKFSRYVNELTEGKKNKVYLRQQSYKNKDIKITSHHNEPYAVDLAFDNGVRNFTSKKALRVSRINILDTEGYWKLFDNLIEKRDSFRLFEGSDTAWQLSKENPDIKLLVLK